MIQKRDNGWGEMAFAYSWDSTSGQAETPGYSLPDLAHCQLYEVTSYADNEGRYEAGWYYPPDPPFQGWKFRDPTDGRTASVGMECFPASHARAWDRHKRAGRLIIPPIDSGPYILYAQQEYRFCCELCGAEERLGGPHRIERRFEFLQLLAPNRAVWRYTFRKAGQEAFLDLTSQGYHADSLDLGFGPWENEL